MSFTASNATLVIKDMEGDAQVNTEGAKYECSNAKTGNSDVDNRAFVYHNLTGDGTIEGKRLLLHCMERIYPLISIEQVM
jgi:hypothetical protein